MVDRGHFGFPPVQRAPRLAADEPFGRLLEGLFVLVERLGWLRATLLCSAAITLATSAVAALMQLLLFRQQALGLLDLLVVAVVVALLAGPGLAVALGLIEHLGRARARLLVEIDRRLIAEQQLRRLATTDELTGLSNRRHFVERARDAIAVAQRYDQWVTLAAIDVDRFKELNDRFGHAAGDRALVVLASMLRANLRATDLAARFGGDEFVLLMPLTDPKAGRVAAERIRRAVRRDCGTPSFEVSVGIASARGPVVALESLMARADQALYGAKRAGRNRTAIAQGLDALPIPTVSEGPAPAALTLKG